MKVLMINGSPHEMGTTYIALSEMREVLEKYGIECEFLASSPPVENGEKMFCDPTLLFDEEPTVRLCGYKEPCFERGECWGHLAGVMCKHQSEIENESGNGTVCYCLKYKVRTVHYDNSYRYNQLKKEKGGENSGN